ncbi:putative iron reductase domain protein [Daldinia caldariorum]|uniref:putative iron reductase domain protein n=1 Tax=Daldinia caldariorum TaxID=326644 RepID=UPI002008C2FB|nr:putative iron reductase domain protein [Daldinia caldariorum]KAI1467796.1 putative iron reductase domain protein [Daldinia caldariorum]
MRSFSTLSRLSLAVSAALSLFTTSTQAQDVNTTLSNATAGSVFVSPPRDLAFALNVPSDSTTDLYFSLMFPEGTSWAAVGLGSDRMAGALILLAYPSESGQNVTFSPRIASGHSEPVFTPEIKVEALEGTGLDNGTFIFNGRCTNCRSWSDGKGKIDVASKSQNMIYATGDTSTLKSDSFDAPLRMHYNYGTFTLDMAHATGPAGVPAIDRSENSTLIATTQGLSKEGKKDVAAIMHAIIMVFVFVGLYPFGIFVLHLGSWVRWHGINQGFALILTIIGSSLGFSISKYYNRSKKVNSAHQVIGILIFIFIFAQFTLGFLHHRTFKKTQQTTKMAPIHVWMGRVIIVMGVINGFLGFPLAQASQYNYVLAGLVLFLFPAMMLVLVTKKFIQKRWNKSKNEPAGYNLEPWNQPNGQAGQGNNPQQPMGQNVSIPAASTYMPYHAQAKGGLGPQQNTREYV